jgi:hypothetical protein
MDTKVLLRLMKDDIKILENLNDSFINNPNLSPEEVEVALARARALVMEFEMLSKNSSKDEESSATLELKEKPEVQTEEKNEKKVRSLRNLLPFIKAEEVNTSSKKPFQEAPDTESTDSTSSKESLTESQPSQEPVPSPIVHEPFTLITDEEEDDSGFLNATYTPMQEPAFHKKEELNLPEEKTGQPSGEEKNQFNNLLSPEKDEIKFGVIPLKSLREGIGLNDRFLFIRELFQNNSDKFEQFITTLDEFSTIEDAVKFLKQNYKWNKSEAAEKFLFLIKRRFSK